MTKRPYAHANQAQVRDLAKQTKHNPTLPFPFVCKNKNNPFLFIFLLQILMLVISHFAKTLMHKNCAINQKLEC